MDRTDYGNILEIASFSGKILLENGGEIYRVEQTVRHICQAYGTSHCECIATPTAVMISIIDGDGEVHSVVRRISKRKVNLRRVELINDFSRNVVHEKDDYKTVKEKLIEIDNLEGYPIWMMTLTAAFGTAVFSVVFGGGVWEFFAGMLSGSIIHLLERWLAKRSRGSFVVNLVLGACCALLGWLFSIGQIKGDWWVITLSSLMLLVPGMLMTNALRDLAAGDYLSGVSRSAEAFCIAAALAGGAAFVFFVS